MQLPLHIFEARYRVMIRACIDEERPFGVALIRSGEEVGGPAEPHAVGTTARITRHETLPDGRMNIEAIGEERFRIDELEQREPHLAASVTLDAMPVSDPREVAALAASVREDYRKALRLTLELQGAYGTHEELPRDPEALRLLHRGRPAVHGQHAPALARISERRPAAHERGQAHAPAAARPERPLGIPPKHAPELGRRLSRVMSRSTGTAVDAARADVLILGGQVIDGSGSEPFAADVAVTEGRIAAVGSLGAWSAARTIRADGLYVTPGFVDMHTHSERGLYLPELAPSLPYLTQGVTTVVGGADGYGSWPLHETMDIHAAKLARQGIGTNAVLMVGAGQVRRLVMGMAARAPTTAELAAMKVCVREAMASGAWGLSSGLEYPPGLHADSAEITALAAEAAACGGMYHTHMRSEGDRLVEAGCRGHRDRGALRGRRRADPFPGFAPTQLGQGRPRAGADRGGQEPGREGVRRPVPLFGRRGAADSLNRRGGRRRLVPRSAAQSWRRLSTRVPDAALLDLYAELAALPSLEPERRRFLESRPGLLREMVAGALGGAMPSEGRGLMELASWYGVHRGPGNPEERTGFVERLDDPVAGARIRSLVAENLEQYSGGAQITIVASARPELEGLSLAAAADAMRHDGGGGRHPARPWKARGRWRTSCPRRTWSGSCARSTSQPGATATIPTSAPALTPWGLASTSALTPASPRSCVGTPLTKGWSPCRTRSGRARDCPPRSWGWSDRGLIETGNWADITVFDPASLAPRSTVQHLHRYSEGVRYVLVNGCLAIDEGRPVGVNAGRVLRIQNR